MSEQILYVKVYNTVDPFGKRLVEKVVMSPAGQKFIKQYQLSSPEVSSFIEQCRMSNIRVEFSSSLGDDAFLSTNANFVPARPTPMMYDPSTTFRSSMNHPNRISYSSSPPSHITPTVQPPPSMINGMSSGGVEQFVDFNDTSNFGACMLGGGGSSKYATSR